MVSAIATAIAAGPVGRSYGKLRRSQFARIATGPIWDWLIAPALTFAIIGGVAWIVLVGR
jgi:hypothetical protein